MFNLRNKKNSIYINLVSMFVLFFLFIILALFLIIFATDAYKNMKRDLEYSAKVHNCSFHELHDPRIVYPENVEW